MDQSEWNFLGIRVKLSGVARSVSSNFWVGSTRTSPHLVVLGQDPVLLPEREQLCGPWCYWVVSYHFESSCWAKQHYSIRFFILGLGLELWVLRGGPGGGCNFFVSFLLLLLLLLLFLLLMIVWWMLIKVKLIEVKKIPQFLIGKYFISITFFGSHNWQKISSCLLVIPNWQKNWMGDGRPWSSGDGRRLVFKRWWVQMPAPNTGWTFFTLICC